MKRKVIVDVIFSMVATFIPIFGLQFFVLPQVALKIDAESYGQLIALVALINLFASAFGSVLNNSRLIHYKKYEESGFSGDYSIMLMIFIVGNLVLLSGSLFYYTQGLHMSVFSLILVTVSSVLLLVKTYATVEFRIKLNFKNILFANIALLIGYGIGFLLFMLTLEWTFIYVLGFSFSLVYVYKRTEILREPLVKTPEFNSTFKQTNILLASGILVSLGGYIDKILLFPLVGGAAVSVYFVATLLGKTISLAIGPITGVLLSYLAQYKNFSHKNFKSMVAIIGIIGVMGYFLIIKVSEPLLTILYPQFAQEALKYIHITTIAIMLKMMSGFINPVILKFTHARWQFFITGTHILFYVALSFLLQKNYGLMGFCIGIMISQAIKLSMMLIVYKLNKSIIDPYPICDKVK